MFPSRTKQGHPVYIEIPKRTNMKALRAAGVTMPMFLYHYMFISEYLFAHTFLSRLIETNPLNRYLWNEIEPDDNATSFSILDMAGVGISDFMGDVKVTVMEIMKLTKAHYPARR
jgi:hypothetical protein